MTGRRHELAANKSIKIAAHERGYPIIACTMGTGLILGKPDRIATHFRNLHGFGHVTRLKQTARCSVQCVGARQTVSLQFYGIPRPRVRSIKCLSMMPPLVRQDCDPSKITHKLFVINEPID